MPHEIEVAEDGTASFFSAREVPWHKLGTVTPNALTAAEAMKTAHLDWTVIKDRIKVERTGEVIPDKWAISRSSDDKVLGTIGGHYVPFNNVDAFRFMDNLVDDGDALYETAGSLRGGKIVFMTIKLPKGILVGGEDAHDLYLLLRTSHDGTKAISVYVTPIRVRCMNTLALATYGHNVRQKWSVTHVSTIQGRLAEARSTLKLTYRYAEEFQKIGDRLLKSKINDADVSQLLDRILPDRPRTPDVKTSILKVYHESPTVTYRGTSWGALNAISEWFDHHRRQTSDEARLINTVDGVGAKTRNTAAALLLARA